MLKYLFEQFLLPAANYNLSHSGIHSLSLIQLASLSAYLLHSVVTWHRFGLNSISRILENLLIILKIIPTFLSIIQSLPHRFQNYCTVTRVKGCRNIFYVFLNPYLLAPKRQEILMQDLTCFNKLQIIKPIQKTKQSSGVIRWN